MWVLMAFSLFAVIYMEEEFTYWLLIPTSITLLLFIVQRASLMYKKINIPCTKQQFNMALKKTIRERNWKSHLEKDSIYKATRSGIMSREGQLITVEYRDGIVYANSISFPGPTTNPFAIIANRKNISALTKNIKTAYNTK